MKNLNGREFARLLETHGWELKRIHGSHHVYGKSGHSERISVPIHGNKALKKGLQTHLMKQAGLDDDDL